MIATDSINKAWFVTKWDERQYESDQSAGRMRKHRAWNADATARYWTDVIRRQLASAQGPLARSMTTRAADAVEEEQGDGR